jgi:hypothetical protein
MSLIRYIERLQWIDELISPKAIGIPEGVRDKLNTVKYPIYNFI